MREHENPRYPILYTVTPTRLLRSFTPKGTNFLTDLLDVFPSLKYFVCYTFLCRVCHNFMYSFVNIV